MSRLKKTATVWEELIKDLIIRGTKSNATRVVFDMHKCAAYFGWCIEIVVKKHEHHCEDSDV